MIVSKKHAHASRDRFLKLYRRRFADGGALVAEVEESFRRETERGGEQDGRETLDAGIVFLHRIVEEASRRRDLVLEIGQFGLQLLEIGVGFEVGVGFREREYL